MGQKATTSATCMAVGLAALVGCSQTNATMNTALTTEEAVESYSLGVAVAEQAIAGLGEIDQKAFVAGISDVVSGDELAVSAADMMAALDRFDQRRMEEARAEFEAMAQANRTAGDAFRASFSEDPAVVTTETGLQYKVIEAGEGAKPGATDTVTVHYRGTLVDGREIDSTYTRGEPVTIPMDRLMPGWTEALTLMPAGSKWQIVLPPELAFGESGAGPMVGPGTTVIFEMELVSIG